MAVLLDDGAAALRSATSSDGRRSKPAMSRPRSSGMLEIGLVNNLPAASRLAGERQFRGLLEAATGALPVTLRRFSLTADPQDPPPGYEPIGAIWQDGIDALIVTGAEPATPDLRAEPYWGALADLLDGCARDGVPTLLSCLAAHAGVLHADGIPRTPLSTKRFGLYRHDVTGRHELLSGVRGPLLSPHSRWNEVDADALAEAGYRILTRSAEGGVDLFLGRPGTLSLHFQGHPEYEPETLMLEYRRDVKRFLAGERDRYPDLPCNYFDAETVARLERFRLAATTGRAGAPVPDLTGALAGPAQATWRGPAGLIIGNWLAWLRERRA